MTDPDEAEQALAPVAEALDRIGVRWQLGGSVASSIHGVPRTSLDVDLLADLDEGHVAALHEALRGTYYADAEAMLAAVRCRRSFNVIHLATMVKVDVFVAKERPFDRASLARRGRDRLSDAPASRTFYVASPEDMVVVKLEWFEKGGRVSQKQWDDVLGVLRTQGSALDLGYVRRWARDLGVEDLLDRALAEARIPRQ